MDISYQPRILDARLRSRLQSSGAVVIEGAKGTGKTATASQVVNSSAYLDTDVQLRRLLDVDPALVLEGTRPRLLDEWQVAPELWNYVRRAVDEAGAPGQFVLTGSAVPLDDRTRHSGAGRFSRLRLRPLTMLETGHSTGAVSLAALIAGEPARAPANDLELIGLVERLVRGGFPGALRLTHEAARRFNSDYLDQMSRVDIASDGRLDHDPHKVSALLRSIARNTATEARTATLASDLSGGEGPLARATIDRYLDSLRRVFLLEEQPAWSPALRSSATLRKAPKRHLVDVALAAAALNSDAPRLLRDPNTLGFAFESFVYQHLLAYGAELDATVYHYRDSNGLEADAILQTPSGDWLALEVKLGANQIDAAALNLQRVSETVATSPPTALVVITPTGYAYQRADGVNVVPLSLLGP
ncbi:MAG TPA: DUF4143 domain-containing protein [Trueperaceae bacterium]|nr:DUF4143 domain-containing protein [Trueperaceae bacterium]